MKSDFQQIPSSTFEKKETKKNTCQTTSTNNKNYNTYGASLIVHINRTEMKKEKKDHKKKQKKHWWATINQSAMRCLIENQDL